MSKKTCFFCKKLQELMGKFMIILERLHTKRPRLKVKIFSVLFGSAVDEKNYEEIYMHLFLGLHMAHLVHLAWRQIKE